MTFNKNFSRSCGPQTLAAVALAALTASSSSAVFAGNINTGNPDIEMRWDNTVRYNLARRMLERNPLIANNSAFDQSDFKFDKGDTISNRLDLVSEFDLVYRRNFGARVSASAWYDDAYDSTARTNPIGGAAFPSSYANARYSNYTKRFYVGPSGELLDAFVFGNVDLGAMPLSVKLGRHAIVWGEAQSNTQGIAYGQAPNDGRKGASIPGASFKETALPISQVSATLQLADNLALSTQYVFEWRPNRSPEGGTYLAGSDSTLYGPNVGRAAPVDGRRGDWGVSLRWRPDAFDGTLGIYYRDFDEKQAWAAQRIGTLTGPVFARGLQLYGLSMAKNIFGVSVGGEISYRKNSALNSLGSLAAASSGYAGAQGSTWHAVINATYSQPKNRLFNAASMNAEIGYSRLSKVVSNPAMYKAVGAQYAGTAAGCNDNVIYAGCSTKDFFSVTLAYTPQWSQILSGVDLSMPLTYVHNLEGNAPVNGGGSEGAKTFKIGLAADVFATHTVTLAYTGYATKMRSRNNPPGATYSFINGAPYADKDWVSLTYQTAF